jgi:hypothetical protein
MAFLLARIRRRRSPAKRAQYAGNPLRSAGNPARLSGNLTKPAAERRLLPACFFRFADNIRKLPA